MSNLSVEDLKKDVKVIFYKSSGPGGQRKNKRETAVRLHHIPTGVTAIATEHRYQSANLELAFNRLREKLRQLNKKRKRRIPTSTKISAIETRLQHKKLHSQRKSLRRKVDPSEEIF
jgi:protein subunit release factor A